MTFAAKLFYRTSITRSGIQRQFEQWIVVLPNPETSENEDDSSGDEGLDLARMVANTKKSNFDEESDF